MHILIRREDVELVPALPDHSGGLTRAVLIGGHNGATHTGLTLVELRDGHVDTHLHSFETTFYVLAVYFGSVKIKNTRYALSTMLLVDLICVFAAIFVCLVFFQLQAGAPGGR